MTLRRELAAIEQDLRAYRDSLPDAIDAPVTSALQDEAGAWIAAVDRAESALTYWIGDIGAELVRRAAAS